MTTKLTLSLDDQVIKNAKIYAKHQQTSVSKLVEVYLSDLIAIRDDEPELTGVVAELASVLEGVDLEVSRSEYLDYLSDKYR